VKDSKDDGWAGFSNPQFTFALSPPLILAGEFPGNKQGN
jgi:hypothetical protein